MKLTFDEALVRFILKNHRNLLIASAVSMVVIILLSYVTFNRLNETQSKISTTGTEIAQLKSSFSVSSNLVKELQDKVPLLSQFLPNDFDLMLMLQTIEEIGTRTDFNIQSVSLGSEKTVAGQLYQKNVQITASGTFDAFLNFLKNYRAVTGQIISMAAVSLSGKDRVISNLDITMYAYRPNINLQALPEMKNLEKNDRELLDVITEYVKLASDVTIDDNYKAKDNPFQKQ